MQRPLIGVGLIIRYNGKILLQKRLCEHANGNWACPGGHFEMWETFEECALRELQEEVGNDIKVTAPTFFAFSNTRFYNENKHYVVFFYVCDYISGEIYNAEPNKGTNWQWFDWNNLPQPLMMGTQDLINRGLNPFKIGVQNVKK